MSGVFTEAELKTALEFVASGPDACPYVMTTWRRIAETARELDFERLERKATSEAERVRESLASHEEDALLAILQRGGGVPW